MAKDETKASPPDSKSLDPPETPQEVGSDNGLQLGNEEQSESENEATRAEVLEAFRWYMEKGFKGWSTAAKMARLDEKSFRVRLLDEYMAGSIAFHAPENHKMVSRLETAWPGPTYHVLETKSPDLFSDGAAEVWFTELNRMLATRNQSKELSGKPLHIGIVSGRSTGGMISSICSNNLLWRKILNHDALPQTIFIYALNVSQTDGYDQLQGNSNILAFELAQKFKQETKVKKVEAFGLSTDLLQTKDQARASDKKVEIAKVLKNTNPERLRKSLGSDLADTIKNIGEIPESSQLDIVISGVGSIGGSLFQGYCKQNGFDLESLREVHRIVGDIAYSPVDRAGKPVPLTKDGIPFEFYSAISLDVLKSISADPRKRAFIVARSTDESPKDEPILAAISGRDRYCNVLISDTETSKTLQQNWSAYFN